MRQCSVPRVEQHRDAESWGTLGKGCVFATRAPANVAVHAYDQAHDK